MSSSADSSDPNIIYGGPLPATYDRGCRSLGELVIKELSRDLNKVALVNGVTCLQLTNGGILDQLLSIAGHLSELGVGKNDVVAIVSENRFEYTIAIYGAFLLGAAAALFNPGYTEREMEHAIRLAKPKVIFVSAQANLKVQKACIKIRRPVKFIHFDNGSGGRTWHDCLENSNRLFRLNSFVPEPVDLDNHVALIVMSSGTTGLPKGVQITQRNVITTCFFLETLLNKIGADQEELVAVDILPWFHVAGGVTMINCILNGMRLVYLSKFVQRTYLACIEKYRPNTLNMVPPIAVFLAKNAIVDEYDLSSVKTIISGAAPLSREVEDLIRSRLKVSSVRQAYGMSETTLAILAQVDAQNKPGSVGKIREGQWAKVIDTETGRTLGPYQNGELCFKGTLIMKGYIGREEAIDSEGWLHTGDIGYYDNELDFFIVDRLKELIKYKAFQVPPAELEAVLLSHPNVKDAAVIGVPDEKAGELAMAFVVAADGVQINEREIIKFVNDQLSVQKHLHGGVRFISEIPKTASGKILRRTLREQAKNKSKL
ncbi:luciferin 4-monooxygenase [Aedes aegypti]|uniref:Luciferin 4-monooxygenase n=1 Tax=Aedes aegypti TaxID=7159 RepID=A0A1S4EUY3_AEDAE|nr:luciferin 4-monooxygenase [Aedes aegypti]